MIPRARPLGGRVTTKLSMLAALLAALVPSAAAAQWTRELDLASGAFDHRGAAPDVVAHAPAGFDARQPLHLVVFVHGYDGCARVLVSDAPDARCREGDRPRRGWGLAARHDEAGTRSLFLVVQLALARRDGSPGRLGGPGRLRALLDETLAALEPELGARRSIRDVESVTLLAHSAGFEAALAFVRHGGVDALRNVVLFDALYSGGPAFAAWVRGASGRRLVSFHGGRGTTATRSADLARSLSGEGSRLEQIADRSIVLVRTDAPHADVPARHVAETLRALGLPLR